MWETQRMTVWLSHSLQQLSYSIPSQGGAIAFGNNPTNDRVSRSTQQLSYGVPSQGVVSAYVGNPTNDRVSHSTQQLSYGIPSTAIAGHNQRTALVNVTMMEQAVSSQKVPFAPFDLDDISSCTTLVSGLTSSLTESSIKPRSLLRTKGDDLLRLLFKNDPSFMFIIFEELHTTTTDLGIRHDTEKQVLHPQH
jgi:hypothetical protein